jgi:alcohol dehydrogenase
VFAIQYAKQILGAYVCTTASEKKTDFVKSLGADEVIDYKTTDFTNVLKDYDYVFDTTGEAEKAFKILKPKGYCISIATLPSGTQAKQAGACSVTGMLLDGATFKIRSHAYFKDIHYEYCSLKPDGKQLSEIGDYFENKGFKVVIDKVFKLSQAKEAFKYLEDGRTTGKNVFEIKK